MNRDEKKPKQSEYDRLHRKKDHARILERERKKREANRELINERAAASYHRNKERLQNTDHDAHGAITGYTRYGCREECCREAKREYERQRYARKKEEINATRREQAAKKRGGQPGRVLIPCPSRAAYGRGCRCDGCKAAIREHSREQRKRPLSERNVRHGNRHGYDLGCRCLRCVEARRAHDRAYYAKNKERINKRKAAWHEARRRKDAE